HRRRQDEREDHRGRRPRPGRQVAEPHAGLGGQRTGECLAGREGLLILLLAVPASLLDEIAVHVSDESDRATEARAAELREVADQAAEGAGLSVLGGLAAPTGVPERGRGLAHEGSRPSIRARRRYS